MRPRLSCLFGVLLGVLGHAAAAFAQAGNGSWVSIGPEGIGAILSLAIDPTATAGPGTIASTGTTVTGTIATTAPGAD